LSFFENRNKGIRLVKQGKNLMVYKNNVVGPTDIKVDFFAKEDSKCRDYSYGQEHQLGQQVLVLKGVEEGGIAFRLVIDPITGKIIRTSIYRS